MYYYKFNISDWALSTSHLTEVEELVYFRLMNHYYDTEQPIPLETQSVIRRLRLANHSDIVGLILSEFFDETENGWIHFKCDEVIKDYHSNAEKNKRNGKKGGRPRKNKGEKPNGLPVESQGKPKGNPNYKPITTNQEPETKDNKSTKSPKFSQDDLDCANWFFGLLLKLNPNHKKPNLNNWADEIRKIVNIDNRSYNEISDLMLWVNQDSFWSTNILSPKKLRDKWDELIIKKNKSKPQNRTQQRTESNLQAARDFLSE